MVCFEVKEIKFKVDGSIQVKPIMRDSTKERDVLAYCQIIDKIDCILDRGVGRRPDPP